MNAEQDRNLTTKSTKGAKETSRATSVIVGSGEAQTPSRIGLDTRNQRDIVVSGIRVNIVELWPYSV